MCTPNRNYAILLFNLILKDLLNQIMNTYFNKNLHLLVHEEIYQRMALHTVWAKHYDKKLMEMNYV